MPKTKLSPFITAVENSALSKIKHPQTRYDLAFWARKVVDDKRLESEAEHAITVAACDRLAMMWIRTDDENHDHAAMFAAWKEIAK